MPIDTFSEPYTRDEDSMSLADVRDAVHQLEEAHKAKGTPLSGRILQVTHYIPVLATFAGKRGDALPSPPITPEPASPTLQPVATPPEDVPVTPSTPLNGASLWTVAHRTGHDAMVSGIKSLSETHEQVLVGWTGDIHSAKDGKVIPAESLTEEDRKGLEEALASYKEHADEIGNPTSYKPVWLTDKVAHKHYEGYSKHSESCPPAHAHQLSLILPSALAPLSLPPLARRRLRNLLRRLRMESLRPS